MSNHRTLFDQNYLTDGGERSDEGRVREDQKSNNQDGDCRVDSADPAAVCTLVV